MLGLIIAIIVTVITGYLIIKKYKAQTVLMVAGSILMACSVFIVGKPLLAEKAATGFTGFDIFKYMTTIFQSRTANLGMIIMAVAGFTRYMDKIGASKSLVKSASNRCKCFMRPILCWALAIL